MKKFIAMCPIYKAEVKLTSYNDITSNYTITKKLYTFTFFNTKKFDPNASENKDIYGTKYITANNLYKDIKTGVYFYTESLNMEKNFAGCKENELTDAITKEMEAVENNKKD